MAAWLEIEATGGPAARKPPGSGVVTTGYRSAGSYTDIMVRNTRQREAIRSAFMRADRPLSPAEALILAGEEVPGMGQSTVYRTIASLVEEGWLKAVNLPGQPDRYETAGRRHHHHFHCTRCGGVFEVLACPGDLAAIAPAGFEVHDHEVILTGWCKACAADAAVGERAARRGHVHVAGCLDAGCEAHAPTPAKRARSARRSRGA